MTSDAETLAWRASAGRVVGAGWVLGAVGGAATVFAAGLLAWLASSSVDLPGAAASVVAGCVGSLLAGAPVGGVGGIWGAAVVLAARGRRPSPRRGERIARSVAAALLVGLGVVAVVVLDVADALARLGGPVPDLVTLVLGALATVRIAVVAGRIDHEAPHAPDASIAAPSLEPFALGAVLGPIAMGAAPLLALVARDEGLVPLTATGPGLAVLMVLPIGPLVGLGFAAVVGWPWTGSDDWPRRRSARVVVVVVLQVLAAALLALLAFAILAGDDLTASGAIACGIVILATQLALLVASWRSHARHAADLNHSR